MKARVLLVAFAGLAALAFSGRFRESASSATAGEAKKTPVPAQSTETLTVYYFHGKARCGACNTIEQFTREAAEAYAAERPDVTFRVVNVDEGDNASFAKKYKLKRQSSVLSLARDGKETKWKNLEKVWELLADEAAFKKYVRDEMSALFPVPVKEKGK